jgi:hypothetical protein
MEHRVETLRIAVHTPAGREAAAARLAERFTREVVERFGEIVETRFPGRVMLIRQMALRWSLSEAEMADPAEATSRAAELADMVAAQADGSLHASDTIAMFADEAAWLTAYLRERAAGAGEGWFHAAWREAERPGTVSAPPLRRETVLAALAQLRAAGMLPGVLAGLPRPTVIALAAALGTGARDAARAEETAAATGRATTRRGVPDARLGGGSATGPVGSEGVVDFYGQDEPVPDVGHVDAQQFVSKLDAETALIAAVAAAARHADEEPLVPAAPASPGPADIRKQSGLATRFGGLFYLLSLALELGIGESLWKVCLPEGLILAHAAAFLLGPDSAGDPAPAMFGGVTISEMLEWPAVSPEQQAEVATELLAATAAALPRYGAAPNPEIFLDLVPSPAGRMLTAVGQGPFALFAWPAYDARATAAGVAAVLSVWPAPFPRPRARDVLLNLDTSGRLRSASGPMVRAALFLSSAPAAPASSLLAQVCGAMAELFALRAGGAGADASEVVSRYLAISGRVELAPEAMTVVLPMSAIDLAVRRAALDRDPGWVPWLRRTVRLEFAPDSGGDVI